MKNFTFLLLLFCSACFLSSCNTTSQTSINKNPNFRILDSGAYGGISQTTELLVNNESEYNRIFTDLNQNKYPGEYPAYSAGKSYVFITFGEKSSGGLDYEVRKVENLNNKVVVTLTSLTNNDPNKLSIGTQAIANPYLVLEINKTNNTKLEVIKE